MTRLTKTIGYISIIALASACSDDVPESAGGDPVVKTSQEVAGSNCASGGIRIDTGRDLDGNGELDADEIDDTTFVCNANSPDPSGEQLVDVADEEPGANCAAGGIGIHTGLDNGDGDGIAADGILQVGERDQSNFLCNEISESVGMLQDVTFDNCSFATTQLQQYDFPRGGLAVTPDHVFISSDGGVTRFDGEGLTNGTMMSPTAMPGLFADLDTKTLHTLSLDGVNPITTGYTCNQSDIAVTHILEYDAALSMVAAHELSSPIDISNNCDSIGIYTGEGYVLVGAKGIMNKIDLVDASVATVPGLPPRAYGYSNIATGVADFDGQDHGVYYMDNLDLRRKTLTTLDSQSITHISVQLPAVDGFQPQSYFYGLTLDVDAGRWLFATYGTGPSSYTTVTGSCDAMF